jgi:hypothetical protein
MAAGDTPSSSATSSPIRSFDSPRPDSRLPPSGSLRTPRVRDNASGEWKDGVSLFLRCRCHRLGGQRRVDAGDDLHDQADGVPAVIGRALGAAGPPVPVAAVDALESAAGGARFPDPTADRAVPVLAAPLVGAQVLAALGAGRSRDARRAGRARR